MIKVAHVTTIPESLKMLLLDQLRAIREAGYDVTGISAPGDAAHALDDAGLRHVAVPFVRATGLTPVADLRAFAHLVRLFRREKFTVVHTHTAKPDLYAAMAARAAGVPIVITTLHGFYFHDLMPARTRRFYANLARIGMACCDEVLSQNPEDIDTAVREKICTASKISLLYNGIDVTRFDARRLPAGTRERMRTELGIAADAPVVGFAGRLVAEKGVPELLAAARTVLERFPTARLLLVGMFDRAKADAVRDELAREHGVEAMCVFTGQRDDMPELFAAMDVFVLPSHREGFPRTVMEASAMSLPVVATNIRGCRTAVEDGRTGILVPLRDVTALAEAICRLLGNAGLRREMGQAGRALAEASFDQQLVFGKVMAAYERQLTARGLPVPRA
jgi:glycosyltransferase involved in cell wall biosynthesis